MKGHGLLQEATYRSASLTQVHAKASPMIKQLCEKFSGMPKETFYRKHHSFYVFGPPSAGKTWFLHALAHHWLEEYHERSLWFITAPNLYSAYMNTARIRDDTTWVQYLLDTRIVLLDDLGLEYRAASGFAETKLEGFLRTRFGAGKITVVSGNGDMQSLEKIYGESFGKFMRVFIPLEIGPTLDMRKVIRRENIAG